MVTWVSRTLMVVTSIVFMMSINIYNNIIVNKTLLMFLLLWFLMALVILLIMAVR